MTLPFFHLQLRGTAKEMGSQHGEILREPIRALADERLQIILSSRERLQINMVEHCAQQVVLTTKRLFPDVFEEAEATAAAAGIEHWRLLVAGGFSDIIDLSGRTAGAPTLVGECTIWPQTAGGSLRYLVGTWDTHASAADALVLVERFPNRGAPTLALSSVGWPMQQGVTEQGLAFTTANLVSQNFYPGTSFICALPEIAQRPNASDASHRAREIPLCSARYYALLDETGAFVGVETDGHSSWCSEGELSHANHFIISKDANVEGRPEIVEQSRQRSDAASMFRETVGGDAAEILTNLGGALGRRIIQRGVGREDRTCAAFALDPADRKLYFSPGDPSSNEYWEAQFGGPPKQFASAREG